MKQFFVQREIKVPGDINSIKTFIFSLQEKCVYKVEMKSIFEILFLRQFKNVSKMHSSPAGHFELRNDKDMLKSMTAILFKVI